MNLHLIIRRIHLYLGMFLLPWFFVYGISSALFSHPGFFRELYRNTGPEWTTRLERPYELPLSPDSDLKEAGSQILREVGLDGNFAAYRPDVKRLEVYRYDFWSSTRITYFIEEKRLLAEDHNFRWDRFLTGMHARGGFQQDSILHDSWAVVVDVVCIAIVAWIATGIYMWWLLRPTRAWGFVALGAGAVSFAIFMILL